MSLIKSKEPQEAHAALDHGPHESMKALHGALIQAHKEQLNLEKMLHTLEEQSRRSPRSGPGTAAFATLGQSGEDHPDSTPGSPRQGGVQYVFHITRDGIESQQPECPLPARQEASTSSRPARKKGFEHRKPAPTAQYEVQLDRSTFTRKPEATGGKVRRNFNFQEANRR